MTEASRTITPLAVSVEDCARLTGHTRSGVYEAIAKGSLTSFKSGKRRLILYREMVAWLNRIAQEGPDDREAYSRAGGNRAGSSAVT